MGFGQSIASDAQHCSRHASELEDSAAGGGLGSHGHVVAVGTDHDHACSGGSLDGLRIKAVGDNHEVGDRGTEVSDHIRVDHRIEAVRMERHRIEDSHLENRLAATLDNRLDADQDILGLDADLGSLLAIDLGSLLAVGLGIHLDVVLGILLVADLDIHPEDHRILGVVRA